MSLQPGQQLLHYRIVEQIGEGGMGVVWKAVDTTLNREVAIKVLPPMVAQDAQRLARFDREAKLLASLNHANIASVFGLHEDGEIRFLVMEFVEGEDLLKRLERGRMSLEEALGIARQIADALQSAHERGVVHRDLKPANILITPEGKAKVLDFGLAKAFEPDAASQANPTMSPTLTSQGTVAGMILGTAGYMSPEQARGDPADKRSDVWAFGVVLYEMLGGSRAFHGDTVSDTLASVLKLEPDWSLLPGDLPRGVQRLLRRCLHKDPRQRLHDIADARIEIDEALAAPHEPQTAEGTATAAPARTRWVDHGAARRGGPGRGSGGRAGSDPVRNGCHGAKVLPSSGDPRGSGAARGRAALARRQDDRLRLHRQAVAARSGRVRAAGHRRKRRRVRSLLGTRQHPGGVPGGRQAVAGSRRRRATHRDQRCPGQHTRMAAWSTAQTIILHLGEEIRQLSARGGESKTVHAVDSSAESDFHDVNHLPDGRGLVFVVHRKEGGADTLAVWSDGERKTLLQIEDAWLGTPAYSPTGHILFTRERRNEGVWALPFSLASLEATGEPFLVVPDGYGASVSDDGTLVCTNVAAQSAVELIWVNEEGEVEGTIGQPQSGIFVPGVSPDGTKVAVSGEENDEWDIWVHDAVRRTKTRLTFTEGIEGGPRWSADGETIFFFHPVFGEPKTIYRVAADGSGEPEEVVAGEAAGPVGGRQADGLRA